MKILKLLLFFFFIIVFYSCENYSENQLERARAFHINRDSVILSCNIDSINLDADVILHGYLDEEEFCFDDDNINRSAAAIGNRTLDLYENGFIVEKVFIGYSLSTFHFVELENGFEIIFLLDSPIKNNLVNPYNIVDSVLYIGTHEVHRSVTWMSNGIEKKPDYIVENAWEFYYGLDAKQYNDNSAHFFDKGNGTLEIVDISIEKFDTYAIYDVSFHIYGMLDCPAIIELDKICNEIDLEWKQKFYIPITK